VTCLLDVNVLVALAVEEHQHHDPAEQWFASLDGGFATCPITEGGLIRLLLRFGQSAATAISILEGFTESPGYEFWPDDRTYSDISFAGVIGHRQVTDAYLAELARTHDGSIATFDSGLASAHGDVAVLIPKELPGSAVCGPLGRGGVVVPTFQFALVAF
jgi:toxin-antitoxin system PIN domain toxin